MNLKLLGIFKLEVTPTKYDGSREIPKKLANGNQYQY